MGVIQKEAQAWVVRLASGQVSERDAQVFRHWCARSRRHATAFAEARAVWEADVNVHSTVSAALAFVQAGAWGRFLRHLPDKPIDLRDQALQQITLGLERLRTVEGIRHTGLRLMAVAQK